MFWHALTSPASHITPPRDYRDGQVVLRQGDSRQAMGLVLRGRLEVYHKSVDGEETILQILEENDTFGVHSLFHTIPRPSGLRALGTARVLIMDNREFLSHAHDNPQLALQVLKSISRRLKTMTEEMKQLATPTADTAAAEGSVDP